MFKIEEKVAQWIEKNIEWIWLGVIILLSIVIRIYPRDFESWDYMESLSNWYQKIKEYGGLPALEHQTGDYTILYQFLIAIMTYIPIEPLYGYKILSCIFDYSLAAGVACLVCSEQKKVFGPRWLISFGATLLFPIVVMDSAIWGQCDCIFSSFIIWFIYLLKKEKYHWSFICLGLAFCFKLQSVFILPFLFIYYLRQKKFSFMYMFWVPAVMILSDIPGVFYGRSLLAIFKIYLNQTSEHGNMTNNMPNIWGFITNDKIEYLKVPAIIWMLVVFAIGLLIICKKKAVFEGLESYVMLATWSVWTAVMLLPQMHERYSFIVCVLLIVLVCAGDLRLYGLILLLECIPDCLSYSNYLFSTYWNIQVAAVIFILGYCIFSYVFVRRLLNSQC